MPLVDDYSILFDNHQQKTFSKMYWYRIRPNMRRGRVRKFVLYHYCQKIVKWAIISENKVKSQ